MVFVTQMFGKSNESSKQFKAQTIFWVSVVVFMIRSTTMDLNFKFNHPDIVLQANEIRKNEHKVGLVETIYEVRMIF